MKVNGVDIIIQDPFTYKELVGWWTVSWCKLAKLLTPTFLRGSVMGAWLCTLVAPIGILHQEWLSNRKDNLYRVQHNGQVCYLRKALNDKFDPLLRRIIISDGFGLDAFYIYTEGENITKWMFTEDENNPIFLHPASAFADTGVDFYVIVPVDLNFDELQMRALVDFYRLASKRYEIIAS